MIQAKEIKLVPISEIKIDPKNRNKHPSEQIDRLVEIIKYQGFRNPVVISNRTGYLKAGEGRYLAAKKLKLKEIPATFQDFDSEEQETAYGISDNAIASWAELDLSGINADIPDLGEDFNVDLLGIKNFSIDKLESEHGCDEDEAPEHVEPKTKLGDIYQLGNHRLMCGDSTSIDAVDKLTAGEKPHLMVTDPPYGVKYEAGKRADARGAKKTKREETSNLSNDDQADWYDAYVLFPGNVAYVWHASAFTDVVMDGLRRAGYKIKQQIIWNKNVQALSHSDYHWKHEPCWYAIKKGSDSHWNGDRTQMTVWDVKNVAFEGDKTNHPTQKPVRIYEIPMENNSKNGDAVYDPFSGSGSGFIAAEKLGRRFYGMELDPKFCDTIIARWEKYTGKKSELLNG